MTNRGREQLSAWSIRTDGRHVPKIYRKIQLNNLERPKLKPFPFNQKFRNWGKWHGISPGAFVKILKSDPLQQKFQNQNGTTIPGKTSPKISANLTRLSSFPQIPENFVPLVTENFRKSNQHFSSNGKCPRVLDNDVS